MLIKDNFDLAKYLKGKRLLKESKENEQANKWDNLLEDEMKWELLMSSVKNPKEAERYIEMKWDNLPSQVTQNIDWSLEYEGQELDENKENPSARELLSDLSHQIWIHWMKYQESVSKLNNNGEWVIPKEKVDRWKRQMETNYNDLSDKEKESDREQADKILKILNK